MNFNIFFLKSIKTNLLVALILTFTLVLITTLSACTPNQDCATIDYVNTSIEIEEGERKHIGFNADTDALKFGKVSAGSIVKRSIDVMYNKPSTVLVSLDSDFSPWVKINPSSFNIVANESKRVFFEVTVPQTAEVGTYSGQVKFCYV